MHQHECIEKGLHKIRSLEQKAVWLRENLPELKSEIKYGVIWIQVDTSEDFSNLLCAGYTWRSINGFCYRSIEDSMICCEISWRFLREFLSGQLEQLLVA
ncbi:MAG: hypothetical protein JW904_13460 [Spirochaetales bacterium]|nr:hypothetical protein [Spirochaetales bacterium]